MRYELCIIIIIIIIINNNLCIHDVQSSAIIIYVLLIRHNHVDFCVLKLEYVNYIIMLCYLFEMFFNSQCAATLQFWMNK